MKNKFYSIIYVSLLLSAISCSKEKIDNVAISRAPNIISFESYTNKTKGASITNDNFKVEGSNFAIYARNNNGERTVDYIGTIDSLTEVTYNGSVWKYSPLAYWPIENSSYLDFYAYYPYNLKEYGGDGLSTNFNNGVVIQNYKVSTSEDKQVDLMYASNLGVSKPDGNNSIVLRFNHALTQVHFKAQVSSITKDLVVDIQENGISITNIVNTGTFTFGKNQSNTSQEPTWDINLNGEKSTYTATSEQVIVNGNNNNPVSITSEENALMLIPQTNTPSNKFLFPKLKINCKIYTVFHNKKFYLLGDDNHYRTIDVDFPVIFKMGKRNYYTLIFGAGILGSSSIAFDTEVLSWDTKDDGTHNF